MTWTSSTRITLHRPTAVALIATGAAGIFALDLFTVPGFAPWILYLWPIWMARWFAAPVAVPLVAAICASLTLSGWALSPPGIDPVLDLLNRVLGVGLFGFAAAFFRTRRRLERELYEQAANLQTVVGHLYEGLITIDERGIVESFNPAAERMFGYAAADVVGRNVSLLMPETDRGRHNGYLADYLAGGPARIIGNGREVTGKRKDGSVFPMELAVAETRLERGRVFIGSVRDVSERRRAEEALRTTSARLEFLLASSPVTVYACEPEPPYAATFVSANLTETLGHTAQEFVTEPGFWADHIHPEDRDRVFAELPRLFAHGRHRHEYRFRHRDGRWRWMQDDLRVAPGPDGKPAELIGCVIDITARKQAEEALRSSRERFELAVRGTHDGLWDWDILTDENYWSDRWHELLGYRPGELVPSYDVWASLLHADDRERVLECVRRHLDQRVPYDLEYRMRTKDGTYRWFHVKGQAVWNASGRPVRMAGSISDVTDRREAGEALDRAKRHLESLIHTVEGVVWEASAETLQFTFVSRKAEALLGYPVARWYEQDFWRDHIHPDDRDTAVATCLKALQDAGGVEFDYRMLAADGRIVWIRDLVSIVPERDGAVAIRGIMADITERKRNEEALRESERFARSTLDALSDHIAVLDETGVIVAVNEAWRSFAAETAHAPHNVGVGANYLAACDSATGEQADEAVAFAAGLREVLQGRREEFALEYACHSPAKRRWFIGRASRFREAGPVRVVVAHENVTNRKLLEDGLRASHAQYQLLVEQAADIIYRTDANGLFTFVNPVAVDIMQYAEEELLGLRFTDLIRPDCRRAADLFYRRQFVRKTPSTYYEFPALRKDGAEIWICQPNLEMSSSSQSRNVRFYVPAAAACRPRSGNSRLRHGWSGL
ncbi:MAG: PAS domain S-box protein, partial [Nitrospira sp.]|nr:PAS domain S-box protein [Nitrospira sp.]